MPDRDKEDTSQQQVFLFAVGGSFLIGLIGYSLGAILGAPIAPQIIFTANGVIAGLAAVLPLAGFLWWFAKTEQAAFAEFRRSQIEFFADIGFDFTPSRIAIVAIAAGIGEEITFRGFLQTWMAGFAPLVVAVAAPNLLFGLLHMRTVLYAIISGCVGIYLGVVFLMTDNLLAPIITHGVYDVIALEYTRRAIRRRHELLQHRSDSNTGS